MAARAADALSTNRRVSISTSLAKGWLLPRRGVIIRQVALQTKRLRRRPLEAFNRFFAGSSAVATPAVDRGSPSIETRHSVMASIGLLDNTGAISGADFFTTEVWTWQGLVTYYTLFVTDLASRRVQIVGSTAHPDEMFMRQIGRMLTDADDGALRRQSVLICDRDRKWSGPVRQLLVEAGIRVVQTPFQAPNANAHAERFVRSIKSECIDCVIVLGEVHLRQTIRAFMT